MTDQWRELKETITELRDNDGTGTQREVCKFLANYMDVLEKQMIDPIDRVLEIINAEHDSVTNRMNIDKEYVSVYTVIKEIREAVLALRGGE